MIILDFHWPNNRLDIPFSVLLRKLIGVLKRRRGIKKEKNKETKRKKERKMEKWKERFERKCNKWKERKKERKCNKWKERKKV